MATRTEAHPSCVVRVFCVVSPRHSDTQFQSGLEWQRVCTWVCMCCWTWRLVIHQLSEDLGPWARSSAGWLGGDFEEYFFCAVICAIGRWYRNSLDEVLEGFLMTGFFFSLEWWVDGKKWIGNDWWKYRSVGEMIFENRQHFGEQYCFTLEVFFSWIMCLTV